ncbi:MAG: hypothetical protein HHJ12_05290 [Glaciimonas sp.]|nr:hypothetical protein [Glaciimonas sp.]
MTLHDFSLHVEVARSFGAAVSAAHADRPMIIENAGIVDTRTCPLETWLQINRDSTACWAIHASKLSGQKIYRRQTH